MPIEPDPSELESEVRQRRFAVLAEQLPTTISANLGLGLLIAFIFHRAAPDYILAIWLAAIGLAAIPGLRAWLRIRRRPPRRVGRRFGRQALVNAVLTAAPWGGSVLLLLPYGGTEHEIALVFLIAGVTAGSIAALAPLPGVCLGYVLTAAGPLLVYLMASGERTHLAMGVMLLGYGAFTYLYVMRSARSFVAAARTDLEKRRLLERLTEARQGLVAANDQLTARVAERTAALAASEARQRALLENASDLLAIQTPEGHLAYASPSAERLLGRSADALIGKPFGDLLHPADRGRVLDALDALSSGEDGTSVIVPTVQLRHADGGHRTFDLTARRVADAAISGVILNARDVTAYKSAEREIAEVRANLLDTLDSIEPCVILYDADGRVALFNRRLADLFPDLARSVRVGMRYEEVLRAWLATGAVGTPETDVEAYVAERLERHHRADGSPMLRRMRDGRVLSLASYRSRGGGVVSVATDVTLQHMTEQRLREAQKMEAIGKLTGGMAHDFNNYLGVIIGNLDLLIERVRQDARARKLADSALKGALRAADLTRSLLAFARRQPLSPKVVDIRTQIAETVRLIDRTLGEDVTVSVDLAPDLWPVALDAAQFDSCLVNLANNARDAMPKGGTLAVSARNLALDEAQDDVAQEIGGRACIVIEMRDSGVGMTPEVLARAVEPFFTTKPVGHGTGIGLSMVYGFVHQSGGAFRIDSKPGEGTVVRLYLPRADAAVTSEPPSASSAAGSAAGAGAEGAAPGARRTVLVVDDNDDVRRTVAEQLESLGFTTLQAVDGEAAAAVLARHPGAIDLLFTDVVMPGKLGGRELAREAAVIRPGIKVLMASGFPGSAAPEGEGSGPRLLRKPFLRDDLARAVADVMRS